MSRPDENKNEHPVVHPIPPVYRRFPDSDSRQFSVRKIQGDRIFLRPSAEPFLESDGSRVRGRGAADRGREEGVSAPESYRCLDVIASCVITGSSDASIRDVVPNPLQDILECADIRQIYCNGATAWKYYRKYQEKQLGREAVRLPSTSPANAAWSVERLLGEWSQCGEVLRNGE